MIQKALCEDYLNDRLTDDERKAFEERIARGDKELIETLNQLKAFRQSETNPKLIQNENDESADLFTLINADSAEPAQKSSKKPSLVEALEQVEENKDKKRSRILSITFGVIMFLLVLFVIYQHWSILETQKKWSYLESRFQIVDKERNELMIQARNLTFYMERIRALLQSDYFAHNRIPLKEDRGVWIQLWDRGTLRTLVMIEKPSFGTGEALQLWSKNARTNEWQLAGTLDKIKADSLYIQWDAQMLARSKGLQIRMIRNDESGELQEVVLGEVSKGL